MKNRLILTATLCFLFSIELSAEINAQSFGSEIFNNGPIITSSGTGLAGADESVLENNTLSMTSFGTAHHSAANLRVADDFTITTNAWRIDSIDFFAYQTNETASTITAINLRIWDGPPSSPGSSIVFGDDKTNILNTTFNSGILRVNEDSQGNDNIRQIAVSNVLINQQFTPGTYWLDWQSDGSGLSGPFVPHITVPGSDTTGNAQLSIDGGITYAPLQDLGSQTNQGLPLIINGSIVLPPSNVQSVPTLGQLSLIILLAGMLLLGSYNLRIKRSI